MFFRRYVISSSDIACPLYVCCSKQNRQANAQFDSINTLSVFYLYHKSEIGKDEATNGSTKSAFVLMTFSGIFTSYLFVSHSPTVALNNGNNEKAFDIISRQIQNHPEF